MDQLEEYAANMWNNSHQYSLQMGDIYYCDGSCLKEAAAHNPGRRKPLLTDRHPLPQLPSAVKNGWAPVKQLSLQLRNRNLPWPLNPPVPDI